jgi:outer membrane protein TolC
MKLIGAIVLLLPLPAPAAEPPLTIFEAASLAAGGAPETAVAGARLEEARARSRAAGSRLGPALFLEAGYLASNDPVDAFALALKQERFSASEFFLSDPNHPATAHDWNAAAAAAWAIDLSGELRGEARAARAMADASERLAARTRDGAAFAAVAAFAAARRSEDRLTVLAERESVAQQDATLAEAFHEEGIVTPADPARARAALAEVRGEIAAENAALAAARAELARSIGGEAASRPLAPLPEATAVPDCAAAERDDAVASRLTTESARAAESAASASRWPSLVLQARYEAHAPNTGARWGDASSARAWLRVPLFASGAVNARVADARASRLEAEASERRTVAAAETEASTARAAFSAAGARVASFAEAESAGRVAREIQAERYREGAASLGDLLEARAAELRARLGVVTARADRILAEARLRLAVGLPPVATEGDVSR